MILSEIFESTRVALEQIFASKLRSFLSTLGVVIGISVVIMMGWLIYALNDVVESTFQMMGTDIMWISRFDWAGRKSWEDMRNRKQLKIELAEEFSKKNHYAELITIQATAWGSNLIKYKNDEYTGISIEGDDYNFQFTPNGEVEEGRYFSQFEVENISNVALIGSKVNDAIFPNGGAIGKTIRIKNRSFIIVGVLKKRGTALMDFVDNRICIPLGTFFSIYGKNRDISIGVKAGSSDKMDEVREESRGIIRILRNLKPWEEDDFSINESKVFEETTKVIRTSVYGAAIGMTALSFLVGIIGIVNIMFVSVIERTKEIGIRKAVGAKNRSILMQFIIESATLCILGAVVSFVSCSVLVYVIATILPKYIPQVSFLSPSLPMGLLIIATVISFVVGIVAGLVPAVRASRLDPVESLKYE